MNKNSFVLLVGLFVASLFEKCSSYFVTVDAHVEECFFEKAVQGTTLGLTFEVAEGGFLDVDIEVRSQIYHLLFQLNTSILYINLLILLY